MIFKLDIIMDLIYTTDDGVEIIIKPGKKSDYDFIVKYHEPGKRKRTPKHIHLIIDLYMKKENNEDKTMELVEHIINMISNIEEIHSYPPSLQFFKEEQIGYFSDLEGYGEYSVEFLLVVTELIMIQEKTNYPTGTMNLKIFKKFREGADIFSVVSAATFR